MKFAFDAPLVEGSFFMKYWLGSIGICGIVGILVWLFYLTFNNQPLLNNQTTHDDCNKVLKQYMYKNPGNLNCKIVNSDLITGNSNLHSAAAGPIYIYTTEDGLILTINPAKNTVVLTDKTGKVYNMANH